MLCHCRCCFFWWSLRTPRSTQMFNRFPYTTLFRSPAEIACLEAAARMTDAGMSAALERLRDGVTDSELAAAAYAAMVEAGSEFMPMNPIVAGGRSEEHTSELQSIMRISYAVFCLTQTIILALLPIIFLTNYQL